MKYIFSLFLICLCCLTSNAQPMNGVIKYNRKMDWLSVMTKMPWMTQEEIDRAMLNFGSRDKNKGVDYLFHFNSNESVFQIEEKDEAESTYSWKKSKFVLQRDYKNRKINDWIEVMGKKYVIKDDIPKYKWKILNEIREIQGYLCMKAETQDTIKNQIIHAWYTDAITVGGGPEGYGGLPGMILEINVNDGDLIVSATKVDLTLPDGKLPKPKKVKGKEIDSAEYNELIQKIVTESMEGERNPYWRIRY